MSDIYPHIRSFPVMSRPFWSKIISPWNLTSRVNSLGFFNFSYLGWIPSFFVSSFNYENCLYLGWLSKILQFFIFRSNSTNFRIFIFRLHSEIFHFSYVLVLIISGHIDLWIGYRMTQRSVPDWLYDVYYRGRAIKKL